MSVPLFDTSTPLAPLRARLNAKAVEVLDGGHYILGPEVSGFEREFADYLGAGHAIGVANGTDALTLALRALGVGPGDEVVVPSFTFYASAEAVPPTGARPVFCDIDPESFCVTPETVRAALTPRTKAVIIVHLFGNVAPVAEIEALGVPVVEDAAQAAGSIAADGRHAGALGTIATFSFFPSKNLGAFGDGGAVTTSDDALAERVRMLRFHGSRDKETFELVGHNSRLDALQAALLRVTLPYLDVWSDGRRAAAAAYEEAGLGELAELPQPTPGAQPAWHLYVVRHPDADELAAALSAAEIGNKAYYRVPAHRQPAMQAYADGADLPVTDELARTHLAIPMSPVLSREQVEEVVGAAGAVAANRMR
ncbi:MAG TPA: DegT/DnrJ/EryC1/StrS family aminotransferase [Solirubrobacteraceae bacterium]|nr:DegT/DnrJ/EryC1/StrS family aminotransferase [Solirubrobacteraceae bacterium]